MDLKKVHKVYMIGIGGIGMSAIARFLKLQGKEVSGYDRTPSPVTEMLEQDGIPVYFDEDVAHLKDAELVVYTPAIPKKHKELVHAQETGMELHKRSVVLGWITQGHKTIAVGGTHGKTSTCGMITHLLHSCGIRATGFIGGITNNFKSNFVPGDSDWIVVEADEFDQSFLRLHPDIAVITSADPDHLDIYGNPDAVTDAYKKFIENVHPEGTVYLNHKVKELAGAAKDARVYGLKDSDNFADHIYSEELVSFFDYHSPETEINNCKLHVPGKYNIENALAAISVALQLGGDRNDILHGLESYSGIKRRFDIQVDAERVKYVDDYAHHPEEIRAFLSALRDLLPHFFVLAVFQPHLYTRTRDFADGFADALSLADKVIMLPIYPAREEPIEGVNSEMILKQIRSEQRTLVQKDELIPMLREWKEEYTVVATIGAGDIDRLVKAIKDEVETW